MQIFTGTYIGNETARSITGVPFAPAFVFVYSHAGLACHVKNLAMAAGQVGGWTSNTDVTAGHITSLNSDGFSVSASASGPNVVGRTYVYVCLSDDSNVMEAGIYTGDGAATQIIVRTRSFTPVAGIVGGITDSIAGAYFRQSNMPANSSRGLEGQSALVTNALRAYSTTDFTVGAALNGNTKVYHYLLLASSANVVAAGSYTHTSGADDRDITISPTFSPTTTVYVGGATSTAGSKGFIRDPTTSGDNAHKIGTGSNESDGIQVINTNGFQVGTQLNSNFGGDTVYYYWCLGAGEASPLSVITLPEIRGLGGVDLMPFAGYTRYKTLRAAIQTYNNLVIGP